MMEIKFSHNYPKLHGQGFAQLLSIIPRMKDDLLDHFIEYDTTYVSKDGVPSGRYPLPSGQLMVLVFVGENLIPFTTVRRYTDEKYAYYKSKIGNVFRIVIKEEE